MPTVQSASVIIANKTFNVSFYSATSWRPTAGNERFDPELITPVVNAHLGPLFWNVYNLETHGGRTIDIGQRVTLSYTPIQLIIEGPGLGFTIHAWRYPCRSSDLRHSL